MPLGIGVALAIPGGSGGHPSPENAFRGFSNVIWKAIFVSRRSRRRGGLRTPARKALASPRHVSVRPPGVRLRMGCEWNASAFVRPSHADAQSAPLRENRLGRHLLAFPVRPSHLGWSTPGRGGLRTPARECRGFTYTSCPLGCPAIVHAAGGNAMPCHSSRWITRAHRVRPSEKKASRVVSGYSPLSYRFALALPRRGGLRTPARTHWASHGHVPGRPPGVRLCIRWECNASACVRPCPKAASLHPFYPTGIQYHSLPSISAGPLGGLPPLKGRKLQRGVSSWEKEPREDAF